MVDAVWSKVLVRWLNCCLKPGSNVTSLNLKSLVEVINKYESDIDLDRSVLSTEDIEPFLVHEYPALRTWYLNKETKECKRLMMTTSLVLFHCVTNSRGAVDKDICSYMTANEQQIILNFCEELIIRREINIYTVNCAIRDACLLLYKDIKKSSKDSKQEDQEQNSGFNNFILKGSLMMVKSKRMAENPNYSRNSMVELSDSTYVKTDDNPNEQQQLSCCSSTPACSYSYCSPPKYFSNEDLGPSQEPRGNICEDYKKQNLNNMDGCSKNEPDSKKQYKKAHSRSTTQFKKVSYDDTGTFKERNVRDTQQLNKVNKRQFKQFNKEDAYDIQPCNESLVRDTQYVNKVNKPQFPKVNKVGNDDIQTYTEYCVRGRQQFNKVNKPCFPKVNCDDTRPCKEQQFNKVNSGDIQQCEGIYIECTRQNCEGENVIDKEDLENVSKLKDDVELKRKALVSFLDAQRKVLQDSGVTPTKSEKEILSLKYKELKKAEDNMARATKKMEKKVCGRDEKKNIPYLVRMSKQHSGSLLCIFSIAIILLLMALYFSLSYYDSHNSSYKWNSKVAVKPPKNKTSRRSFLSPRRADEPPPLPKIVEVAAKKRRESNSNEYIRYKFEETPLSSWICRDEFCERAEGVVESQVTLRIFPSHSRCVIACSGVQLWPLPTGYSAYSKSIVALNTHKLEYKLQTVTSEAVSQHLSEAFTIFVSNLLKQEKMQDQSAKKMDIDIPVRKIYINVDVESDIDPRMRVDTDEAYLLKIETLEDKIMININATSFCGARHGLETLSQVILIDQCTGYLITDSNLIIKDAPLFKYRGLMLDTGRNFIPLNDIMRTIDAMSSCKLNTFHWRVSDVTSFPLALKSVPKLHQYGAYDKNMVYTEKDVRAVVQHAGFRGVRVLMEVAAPGPVGRPWSWHTELTCQKDIKKKSVNILCLRLTMNDNIFDVLQEIYTEILNLTKVDDMFHLSNGLFKLKDCFSHDKEREGFLEKALKRLKLANGGSLPKLPIVWYNKHLRNKNEAQSWERYGIQLLESFKNIILDPMSNYVIIHTWDFSPGNKKYTTWQQVYKSRFWNKFKKFTNEGGEALVWTDFVGPGGLDSHIWPRAAAVAERLWSDVRQKATVSDQAYLRLDLYRWRMLRRGVKVQPLWSAWCSYQPRLCLQTVKKDL